MSRLIEERDKTRVWTQKKTIQGSIIREIDQKFELLITLDANMAWLP